MTKIQNTRRFRNSDLGFTLIELLIVAAMTAILTTIVTVNFRQLRSSQEVSTTASDLISKVREVQSQILTGKVVSGQAEPADAYEIILTTGASSYRIDWDINSLKNTLETVNLSTNVRLNQVYVNNAPVGAVTLRITAPFGRILADGSSNKVVKLDLSQVSSGNTKTVIIDGISGRMGLE